MLRRKFRTEPHAVTCEADRRQLPLRESLECSTRFTTFRRQGATYLSKLFLELGTKKTLRPCRHGKLARARQTHEGSHMRCIHAAEDIVIPDRIG